MNDNILVHKRSILHNKDIVQLLAEPNLTYAEPKFKMF